MLGTPGNITVNVFLTVGFFIPDKIRTTEYSQSESGEMRILLDELDEEETTGER